MRLEKNLIPLIIFGLLLGACSSVPTPGAVNTPTAAETPAATTLPVNPAPAAAIQQLAGQLGVPADQITVVSFEPEEWPNACLGLPNPDESCAEVTTPGYRVVLKKGDVLYVFRTDQSGKNVRLEPAGTVVPQASDAANLAVDFLAKELKVEPGQVQIVSSDPVEWPDACLGIAQPGEMCAQVITPGYKIVLEVQGQRYEVHTNQDGNILRRASGLTLTTSTGNTLLEWIGKGANCQMARFSAAGVEYGDCQSSSLQKAAFAGSQRGAELAYLVSTYQSFQAAVPEGSVIFHGEGTQAATPEEQRSIAEWARLATEEARAGRASAAADLVIGWRRDGGIAGFCDELAVYLTGFAYPTSCKGGGSFGFVRLTADQLKQVVAWYEGLKNFEQTQQDQATADAMTQKLVFTGTGSKTASAADQQAMLSLASEVFASAGTPLAPPSVPAASISSKGG